MFKTLISPLVLFHIDGPYFARLSAAGLNPEYPAKPEPATAESLIAALDGYSAVLAGGEHFTDEVFQGCPQLKVVARVGVGFDRVDIESATRHNVAVCITPTANHAAVAELALSLVFALAKFTCRHNREVRQGTWSRQSLVPLRGRTLGVVGLGRIGRSMALRAAALDMRVVVSDPVPPASFLADHQEISLVPFEELLAQSDFVSVHAPLNAATQHLFNKQTFAQMKSGGYFVNTARGGLVDEIALLAALESGHLAGAGLDVFETEPTPIDNPLLALDNVIATPHMAGVDIQSLEDMALEAAGGVAALAAGEWPGEQIVNPQLREHWQPPVRD